MNRQSNGSNGCRYFGSVLKPDSSSDFCLLLGAIALPASSFTAFLLLDEALFFLLNPLEPEAPAPRFSSSSPSSADDIGGLFVVKV